MKHIKEAIEEAIGHPEVRVKHVTGSLESWTTGKFLLNDADCLCYTEGKMLDDCLIIAVVVFHQDTPNDNFVVTGYIPRDDFSAKVALDKKK